MYNLSVLIESNWEVDYRKRSPIVNSNIIILFRALCPMTDIMGTGSNHVTCNPGLA